jgi:outer membrane immunogenic protein
MRRLFFAAAVMLGAASGAQAADLPDLPILRGGISDGLNSSQVIWQGFYVGAQGGYGSSDARLAGSNSDLAAATLGGSLINSQMGVAGWNLPLTDVSARAPGYGGFAGYNWQWTDAVLSFEASYLHGRFGATSVVTQSAPSPTPLTDGLYHYVTATSSSSISVSDMATIRGRAAYAFGCFLPYAFGGFAFGNADISRVYTAQDSVGAAFLGGYVPLMSYRAADISHNHLVYGYTGGLGMDVSLTAGLFLRAEWEYVRFTDQVDVSINTVRGGLGYKF